MENSLLERNHKRTKRALRIRKALHGTAQKPRLTVMKSNRHIGAQLINDDEGVTLVAVHTQMKGLKSKKLARNKEAARLIGSELAKLAIEKEITSIIFDRGFHKYHGIVAELANAAREAGLQF